MTSYVIGIAFLFIFLVIAFVAFKMLKRTVKMAVRVAIVVVIIAVALAGSTFFLLKGASKPTSQPRSAANR
jgi:uncharacterized protein YqhQ